jgi:hypothetical protein
MAFGTQVTFDSIREKAAGDISSSYVAIGTPISDYVRIITISNSTDQEVYISFNGTDNHLRLAQNSFKLLDLSANKIREDGLFLAVGTQLYVKYVSTTTSSGDVWVEVMYAEGGK